MPRICEFMGVAVYMYYLDHSPPHVHAMHGGNEALFQIDPARLLRGSLPGPIARRVVDWIRARRSELLANWELASDARPLRPVAPLS